MSLRRLESFAMIAAGLALALVGAASLLLEADTSGLNRLPAERPTLEGQLADQTYRDAWEDYLSDKLAIAALGRQVNASLEARVFGDAATRQVIRGQDGWLYFAPAVSAWTGASSEELSNAEVASALRVLEAAGLEPRFALAPHKPSQYPQFLPPNDQRTVAETAIYRDIFRQAVILGQGPQAIDVFQEMADAIAANPDQLYYLREDTHWSDLGAGVMAKAVVESFAPDLWDDSAFVSTGPQSYRPDLVQIEGSDARGQRQGYAVQRSGVSVERTFGDEASGWRRLYQTDSDGAPLAGRLVLIGDSYSVALAPLLAPYFEEVSWVRLIDFDPGTAGPVIADADLALILIVERHALDAAPTGPVGLDDLLIEALGDPT